MDERYLSWIKQALNDCDWGEDSLTSGYFSQSCYIAQQVAEKALKALAYFRGAREVRSHSCTAIARELKINGNLLDKLKQLDQYYINARYPDALPGIAPFEAFTKEQAETAIEAACATVDLVLAELPPFQE